VSSPVETVIASLVEEFQTTRLKDDWPAMRSLLHPDSRLESLAAVGRVLSAEQLVEAVKGASRDGLYSVRAWDVEPLEQRAALASGRVRYRVGPGAITDEARVWVSSERDGLIWRMRIFRDRGSAARCLDENGLSLGL
jgi:hypothetical protein